MPIKNGTVYCVNHPTVQMTRNRGFNAITTFERSPSGFEFNASSGMPIVAYYCNECGYVESYAAQKTVYWKEIAESVDPATSGKLFESIVRNALENRSRPKAIEQNIRTRADGREVEVDLLMRTPEGVFVFEIKSTRQSKEAIRAAAHQVKGVAEALSGTPVLVLPTGASDSNEVDGVRVLTFDLSTLKFSDSRFLEERSPAAT